ncbi:MAG: hypothetical protein Q9183_002678 [Haloplaca sp. 2 TL-2023]
MSESPLPLYAACNLSSDNLCSTAVCCTVRTVLSGAVKGPDVTWNIVPNVAWRLPEVNIGIVCANAPILRPLYLFFRGRLSTQKSVSHTAYSKDKTDVSRRDTDTKVNDVEAGDQAFRSRSDGTDETMVGMEMGVAGIDRDKSTAFEDQYSPRHFSAPT